MDLTEQIKELRKSGRIEVSAVSGYNYYLVPRELCVGERIPVALHRESGAVYWMHPGPVVDRSQAREQVQWYRDFILKPAPKRWLQWPVDMVRINVDEFPDTPQQLYFVFPVRAMPELEPIKKLLYVNKRHDILDWRTDLIRKTVCSFLQAVDAVHEAGYSYNDFNIRRIGWDQSTGRVYLFYNDAVRKRGNDDVRNVLDPAITATEFAPSFEGVDRDLYAVAAILFRLMIGRLPYQGWQIENNTHVFDHNYYDLDREEAYRTYFERYHASSCFVFDPDDDTNRLSPGSEDDQPRERWEKLPGRIRDMFLSALAYTAPARRDKMVLYTPRQWLTALERCCWKKDEGDRSDE